MAVVIGGIMGLIGIAACLVLLAVDFFELPRIRPRLGYRKAYDDDKRTDYDER